MRGGCHGWYLQDALQRFPPIQLALHVEDEAGIHRAGPRARLLPAFCIHCLPSPCGRLSRPRTTTKAPSPVLADHRSLRSSHPDVMGCGSRVLRFCQCPFVHCRCRLYPVRNLAFGPCRLSRRLVLGIIQAPPVLTSQKRTSAPQVFRPPRPLPDWRGHS